MRRPSGFVWPGEAERKSLGWGLQASVSRAQSSWAGRSREQDRVFSAPLVAIGNQHQDNWRRRKSCLEGHWVSQVPRPAMCRPTGKSPLV